ncbi:hypothetical protein EGW08_005648, partial [Elysia chlorotica]
LSDGIKTCLQDNLTTDRLLPPKSHGHDPCYALPSCHCQNISPRKQGMVFEQRDSARHKQSHIGPKHYSCEEFGKCFSVKHISIKHKKTFTGQKPYTCDWCEDTFCPK